MEKAYEPKKYEDDIYKKWEQSGAFQPSDAKETFVIPIPPPNVTGTLHAGHAMYVVQDILIRWHKMMGEASLYVPGTDHAAIATESVVLKNLGIKDRNKEISRADFMKEAEKWTENTHDIITHQLRKIGLSCDWTREAYTFDAPRNLAVNTIFKMLYDKGLIYRGNRMINWSIGAQSVLADDEVEWGEKTEPFYYIRCGEFIIGTVRPETKCANSPVVVSETGKYVRCRFTVDSRQLTVDSRQLTVDSRQLTVDSRQLTVDSRQLTVDSRQLTVDSRQLTEYFIMSEYLFTNEEQRNKVLNLLSPEGKFEIEETFTGKELEGREFEDETYAGKRKFVVLADDEVIDIEKGAGSMTISCCHSADDYDLAKRRNLNDYWIQKIDFEGNMTSIAGDCAGMNVNVARKKSAELMREQGLLVGEDNGYSHRVPICYRSHTVVEPMVSRQWFIAVEKEFPDDFSGEKTTLKKQMQEAVREKHVQIVPERFEKTYFHWIDNLKDWCISRQIWWGHRIPVWYDGAGEIAALGVVENPDPKWIQDEDTLDTWFSSATWPFSIFGWPEKTKDMDRFYPTSVLETGHDILFFWVARMIMFGKFATGKYPFHTVYLHGLVCDEKGKKMSKSKGNGIDPLEIIEEFGTDALRLALIMGTTPGNNSNLGKEKIAGCRNFCNKLWNVSRFILSQKSGYNSLPLEKEGSGMDLKNSQENLPLTLSLRKRENMTDLEKWLISKTDILIAEATSDLEKYRFGDATEKLWNFTWNEFADWALEAAKAENNPQTNAILQSVLKQLLVLLHPFIPFVTEKIWEEFGEKTMLITEKWVIPEERFISGADFQKIKGEYLDHKFLIIQNIVSKIRSMRKLAGVDPTKKITALLSWNKSIGAGGGVPKFEDPEEILKRNAEIIKALARLETLKFGKIPHEKGATDTISGVTIFLPSSGMIDPQAEKVRVKKELEKAGKKMNGLKAKLGNKGFLKQAPKELIEKSKQQMKELEEKISILQKEI